MCAAVLLGEQRTAVRAKYGLRSLAGSAPPDKGGNACPLDECAASIFCEPCAFMQLVAELEVCALLLVTLGAARHASHMLLRMLLSCSMQSGHGTSWLQTSPV